MLGQVIHGYRIDRAMSEDKGGFGDVYFATHVESGAEAVVKVLKPEMSALRDIVTRFFNEARAAASIHHPGIVQIHNVGYHGDRAYLLMERLRGGDLEQRLERGPLPLDRAVLFLRQAAGAIGAAHERGIVHRDLKPANLFVVDDPDVIGGERVKVLDFGIAKLTADTGAGKTQGVFGSPPYMSPEQCASTGAVDARSDLYSLGCIFYELVCGRPPFGHGGIELIASHLRDTPAPPRALAPWVPPAVEQVILALLEKQPERRIPSCAALIAALDEAARVSGLPGASVPHLPVSGGPTGTNPHVPTGRLVDPRHPGTTLGSAVGASTMPPKKGSRGVWLGLGAVVIVGGAVTAVMALGGGHGPGAPPVSGDAGVAAAPVDAGLVAVAAPEDAVRIAVVVPDALVAPDASTAADPRGSAAAHRSQAEIAAQLNDEGRELVYAGKYETAVRKFSEAAARVPEPKYLLNLAIAQFQWGHLEEASTALEATLRSSPPPDIASKAKSLLERVKKQAKAQGISLATHPDVAPADDDNSAEAFFVRGKRASDGKRFEDALALLRRAYELEPQAKILVAIGAAEHQLGRCADARRTLQRVGPTWPNTPEASQAAELLARIGACF